MAKTKLSNSDKALADQKAALAGIRKLISAADRHEEGHRKSLNSALESLYALSVTLLDSGLIRSFVESEGASWGKVQQGNPFQPMVTIAFSKSTSRSSGSKYAKVLHHARSENTSPIDFARWLEDQGGINAAYANAISGALTPYDQQFEDTEEERLAAALTALKDRRIGNALPLTEAVPEVIDAPENVAAYRSALVRVLDGKVELVQVLPGRKEDLVRSLLASVPADPPYARRKISTKPLYDLFRACDLFMRFAVETPEIDEQPNRSLDGSGAVDLRSLAASVKTKSASAKASALDRFRNRSGLLLQHDGITWRASTVNTLPTFVGVDVLLSSAFEALDTGQRYVLSSHQAKRFVTDFPAVGTWIVRVRKRLRSGEFDVAGDGEVVVDKISSDIAWRVANAPTTEVSPFEISRSGLADVAAWKVSLESEGKPRFPKQFAIREDSGIISLAFAGEGKQAVIDTTRQRSFGHLGKRKSLPADVDQRWLLRSDIMEVSKIASDYGVEFQGDFVAGNEGTVALNLKGNEFNILIPLAVSLSGDRASTTSPLPLEKFT